MHKARGQALQETARKLKVLSDLREAGIVKSNSAVDSTGTNVTKLTNPTESVPETKSKKVDITQVEPSTDINPSSEQNKE